MSHGVAKSPLCVQLYGGGGIGKTELAANIRQVGCNPLFIDIENGSHYLDVARVSPAPETLDDIRAVLCNDDLLRPFDTIVIDSMTKAQEYCEAWTITNVPHEKGHRVTSLEGYGFGKGIEHVYDTFLLLLGDLDAQVRRGRNVIVICHECVTEVPNPVGENWIRYEPRLQSPKSGKSSIRHRLKEWCDHLLYIGYDVSASKDGKGTGVGTRTIYPQERPGWWAKSRTLAEEIPYEKGSAELWKRLLERSA